MNDNELKCTIDETEMLKMLKDSIATKLGISSDRIAVRIWSQGGGSIFCDATVVDYLSPDSSWK